MTEEILGTYECPFCGFDKPHTHDRATLQWFDDAKSNPAYDVASFRKYVRGVAEREHQTALWKAEFDADPRAYVNRYGTINSDASSMLVPWLLERIDRLEKMSPIRQPKE